MKILLATHKFAPDVGGIETMSELLAREFTAKGHEVTVVTHTRSERDDERLYPFRLLRAPGPLALIRASQAADVVFHNNICLQFAWPMAVIRRPKVIAVRTWIRRDNGRRGLRDRIKGAVLRGASVISISQAVAAHLDCPSTVIPNSFRDDVFRLHPDEPRVPGSLVFVGRLVDAKGADLLLEAMSRLRQKGDTPTLTVVGDGPQREYLGSMVDRMGLSAQVTFVGSHKGEALARILNRHDIIAIPSVWNEPFGIVGLEGVACGCVAVASEGGGLPDAVGRCGVLFPNGDVERLAEAIRQLLHDQELVASLRNGRYEHVANHTSALMGERYLEILEAAAAPRIARATPRVA